MSFLWDYFTTPLGILFTSQLCLYLIWRLIWSFIRRNAPADYVRLYGRKGRFFLYRSKNECQQLKDSFKSHSTDENYSRIFKTIMRSDAAKAWKEFEGKVHNAKYYEVKPKYPGRVFGWAQTAENGEHLIFGIEPFLRCSNVLVKWTAVHELGHCAQEVRDETIKNEGDLPINCWWRVELEIYWHFRQWPLLFAAMLVLELSLGTLK